MDWEMRVDATRAVSVARRATRHAPTLEHVASASGRRRQNSERLLSNLPFAAIREQAWRVHQRDPRGLIDLDPHEGIQSVDLTRAVTKQEEADDLEDALAAELVVVLDLAEGRLEGHLEARLFANLPFRSLE